MSERSLPPSARRLADARRAGLVASSSTLTAAAAWGGALVVALATAPTLAQRSRDLVLGALREPAWRGGASDAPALASAITGALATALALVAPLVVGAAVAALVVHLVQVRALWLPRRRVPGAPTLPRGAAARAGQAAWSLVRAAALAAAGVWYVWTHVDALAAPMRAGASSLGLAGAALAGATLTGAAVWGALGVVELAARALRLAAALRMTPAERRAELRAHGGASPELRAARRATGGGDSTGPAALAAATVLVVGDDHAAAVRWEPRVDPEPSLALVRRGVGVGHAVALARAAGVPVVRAPALARELADGPEPERGGRRPVPAAARARLAEVVVAVRRRSPEPLAERAE